MPKPTPAEVALAHHCRLSLETIHPRFSRAESLFTIVLTVNSGYE